MSETNPRSAWTRAEHERLYPANFNFGLASFIARSFHCESVLEFGSGLGDLAKYLTSQGRHVDCIEPVLSSSRYDSVKGPFLHNFDLFEDKLPAELNSVYDLVISIEVAEHIDQRRHPKLFDFLTQRTGHWLVFSAARPGQGGHGHIAERPEEEWRSEITDRGMTFRSDLTAAARSSCDAKNINHRRNVMVFER